MKIITSIARPRSPYCGRYLDRDLRAETELSNHSAAIATPPQADSTDPAVSRFLDAVWMERGLSTNTLAAYRADLTALARWLAER